MAFSVVVVLGAASRGRFPDQPTVARARRRRITQARGITALHLVRMTQTVPGLHHRGDVDDVGGVR
jgi:hypothetical protein